jgi:hypothetical protein
MGNSTQLNYPGSVAPIAVSLPLSGGGDSHQAARTVLIRMQEELHSLLRTREETNRKIRDIKTILEWLDARFRTHNERRVSISESLEPSQQISACESDLREPCHKLLADSSTSLTVGEICCKLMLQVPALKWNRDPLFSVCSVLQALAADRLVAANELDGVRRWGLAALANHPHL